MNSDAVPSVFEKRVAVIDVPDDGLENQIIEDEIDVKCIQCPLLKQKVDDLNKKILKLNIQHDIEMQKLKRKITVLENRNEKKSDEAKQYRNDLSQERKENIRMKDVITELKNQNLISTEDEKILNV